MKNKLIAAVVLLFGAVNLHAATNDRFGNDRDEIPLSSFTATTDFNVLLASAPSRYSTAISTLGGSVFLRSVDCYGVIPTTISFYNTITFVVATTTRTKVVHIGAVAPTLGVDSETHLKTSIWFSSGLMYSKTGLAPCTIGFDYTQRPPHGIRFE